MAVANSGSQRLLQFAELGDLDGFQAERRRHGPLLKLDVSAGSEAGNYWNRTPLHVASQHGNLDIVRYILSELRNDPQFSDEKAGRVVNAKDNFGYTPLHLAAREQRVEVVRMLTASTWVYPDRFLAARSEVVDDTRLQCDGFTPLHLAAEKGNVVIAKLLLRRSVCAAEPFGGFDPVNISALDSGGRSPLDIAKMGLHVELVEFLENSDLSWLRYERDKVVYSMNAVLVGAALVAAATFATWLQPPLGIPDSTPLPLTEALKKQSSRLALFFVFVVFSFCTSVSSLVLATFAILPTRSHGSLKSELHRLRRYLKQSACLLAVAMGYLVVAFNIGATLVFRIVTFGQINMLVESIARFSPVVCYILVFYWYFKVL